MASLLNKCNGKRSDIIEKSIVDLRFDSIVGLNPDTACAFFSSDRREIAKRQEIFRDMLNIPELLQFFKELEKKTEEIEEIRRSSEKYSSRMDKVLYSFKEIEFQLDAVDFICDFYSENGNRITSSRLKDFFEEFDEIKRNPKIAENAAYVRDIGKNIVNVRSLTVGINLDASMIPYEIGIIEMSEKQFASSNFYTRFMGDDSLDVRHISPMTKTIEQNQVFFQSVYNYLNSELCRGLKRSYSKVDKEVFSAISPLLNCKDELSVMTKLAKYASEMTESCGIYSFPVISDDNFVAYNVMSPELLNLGVKDIVKNDIIRKDDFSSYLITGANNGGKTVFINMVGFCQLLFQFGLPIPASSAEMKICGAVLCHFPVENEKGESRFFNECRRMRDILSEMKENDLIIMDETFSATGEDEGSKIAASVLKKVEDAGCRCYFSTHLHALSQMINDGIEDFPSLYPMRIVIDKTGTPTHKVEYGKSDDYSHAYTIAEKFGLI